MRPLLLGLSVVMASYGATAYGQSETQSRPYLESPARYTVALTPDGVLEGWVGYVDASTGEFRAAPGALVSLVRRGEMIRQVEAEEHGYFEVEGLAPGVYAVMATDERGFSASAFHIVPPEHDAAFPSMLCTMIAHDDFELVRRQNETVAIGTLLPTGGVVEGTGDTAPASGGSGGGGLGGLLGYGIGAVGLGFGIAALVDDDDSDRQPVASPVFP